MKLSSNLTLIPVNNKYTVWAKWLTRPTHPRDRNLLKLWYFTPLIGLVGLLLITLMHMGYMTANFVKNKETAEVILWDSFVWLIVILQCLSLLRGFFSLQKRMDEKGDLFGIELSTYIRQQVSIFAVYGCICSLSFVYLGTLSPLIVFAPVVATMEAVAMLFTLVDCQTSKNLINQLLIVAEKQHVLTISFMDVIRDEITKKNNRANYVMVPILSVSTLSIYVMVIMLFIFRRGELFLADVIAYTLYFSIEIPFSLSILWKSSEVNELADRLLSTIARVDWIHDEMNLRRVMLYVNLADRPISYEILGMRVEPQYVKLQSYGLAISGIIALLRFLFTHVILYQDSWN